jgi:hypothetical protein
MDVWDQMVDCICRPPRDVYEPGQLLGSPAGTLFRIGPVAARRTDFLLVRACMGLHGGRLGGALQREQQQRAPVRPPARAVRADCACGADPLTPRTPPPPPPPARTQTNKHGRTLQCSHWAPVSTERGRIKGRDGKLPVVVYLHCNSGSRRDAEEAVGHLLPMGIGVVACDFMVGI